jgi:hypothetical protein
MSRSSIAAAVAGSAVAYRLLCHEGHSHLSPVLALLRGGMEVGWVVGCGLGWGLGCGLWLWFGLVWLGGSG